MVCLQQNRRRAVARRAALVALLVVVPVLATGCQAVARVTLSVRPAGDGDVTVTLLLDKEAAGRFGNIAKAVKVADLQRAGWVISAPAPGADGSVTVRAVRRFRTPSEASAVVAQLSGPAGPLHTLHLTYHRSVLTTTARLSGALDLRGGIDSFADPALAQQLGYSSLSSALASLHFSGGAAPSFRFEVATRLLGGVDRAPGARLDHGTAVWNGEDGKSVLIAASSTRRNGLNLALLAVCAASLLGLLLIGLARVLGLGRRGDGLQFGGGRRAPSRRRVGRRDTWRIAERGRRPPW